MEEKFFKLNKKEMDRISKENEGNIKNFKITGKESINDPNALRYIYLDSHIDKGRESFYESFKKVIPEKYTSMKEYIEDMLQDKKGKAIGIEFGGLGYNLFGSFSKGFFEKSCDVTLVDHREDKEKEEAAKKLSNHSVIIEDFLSDEAYEKLDGELNGKKADFIMERIFMGMEFIPSEPYILAEIIQKWYSILSEGGVMFIQTPVAFNHLMKKWGKLLHLREAGLIEFEYMDGTSDGGKTENNPSVFFLRKLKGAPEKLPFLSPKEVNETKRYYPIDEKLKEMNKFMDEAVENFNKNKENE